MVSEGDPREIQDLAKDIDSLMSNISSRTGIGDAARVAILAALHLADELRAAREDAQGLREDLDQRSRRIAALLDDVQMALSANPLADASSTN